MKYIVLIITTLSLFGCVSSYVPPGTSSPSATITYSVQGDPTLGYTAFLSYVLDPDQEGCFASRQLMAQIKKGGMQLGKTNNPPNIVIPAGKKIMVMPSFIPANLLGNVGCSYNTTFTPENGKAYNLDLSWEESCNIELYEVDDGRKIREVGTSERRRC